MNFGVLKRSYLKRNIIIGVIIIIIIIVYAILTKDKYKPSISDFNMIAMYQENDSGEYEVITEMPKTGYKINESNSYCLIDGNKDTNAKVYTNGSGEHVISHLQKNEKCYLYFYALCGSACRTILANNPTLSDERSNGINGPLTEDTTGTLFTAEDDYGTSYIFAGDIDNNWVSFVGYYWRIIRINGDGSIR